MNIFYEVQMIKILKIYFYRVTLLCLVSIAVSVAQTFTGTELLARPTDHSITLNVVSSSALDAYVEYGITSGAYSDTTSHVSQAANLPIVIVLNGLSADATYYYRLRYRTSGSGGAFSARPEYSFHTQRPEGSTFKFDITSDSHVNIVFGSLTFWTRTLTNVANDNPDFHLDLGDTFSMDGVTTVSGAEQAYFYQRSGSALGLISPSVPIFIVNGNHEQQEGWHLNDPGTTKPPILGTNARKKYFPNPIPDSFYSGNIDATSTDISGDHLKEDYYAWQWGDALFIVIDPYWYSTQKPFLGNIGGGEGSEVGTGDNWDWTLGQDQFNWFKQTIESSTAKYKFVFSHQIVGGNDAQDYGRGGAWAANLYEWGGNNSDGTTWGFDTQRPGWSNVPIHQLMVDNNVSAFFHGHDHEYAYEVRDGIVYQEMPAGGFSGTGFANYNEGGYTKKVLPSGGHLRLTVSPSQTTVDYINSTSTGTNGTIAYSYTILPGDPLPVELTTFIASVTKSNINLNWRTATEIKNQGFEVQRKTETSDWGKIGFVQGNGNSNVPKNYSFTDKEVTTGKYFYRLKQIDNDGKFEYSKVAETYFGNPQSYELNQNYPNPFNPSTVISYRLKEKGFVKLRVYDIRGELVKVLVNETKGAGDYKAEFNGKGLASGVYIYRIEVMGSGNNLVYTDMNKTILLK